MSLHGKKVVIVGGSSGIGLAVAHAVVEQGAHLVIAARSQHKLEHAQRALGHNVEIYQLDATDEEAAKHFFTEVGELDHLVTSVTTSSRGTIMHTDVATVRHWFETKYWGQYIVARSGARHLRTGGSITLFSGAAASKPLPGGTAIAGQNGAVESFALALAFEIAPLRVNVVSPGVIDTPLWDQLSTEERDAMYTSTSQRLPVRRVGLTSDCVSAVLFLMSNSFVTGTVLRVDGGVHLV